ncbi:MAG: BrnA antitoxin family protein [Stellaceae bacterium]
MRALTDEDIERAVAGDPDAAPLLDAAWFASARAVMPPEKEMISIRLDKDVVSYFRSLGPGYQTRINALLRALMERARDLAGGKRGAR